MLTRPHPLVLAFMLALLAFVLALFAPAQAHAQSGFAAPPDETPPASDGPLVREGDPRHADHELEPSELRLSTGPVLRATRERADGGFGVLLDIGQTAAGLRVAGSWVRAGSDRGLSQYDAELWLDFGAGERLHPIVAAGAGLARVQSADARGTLHDEKLGVALLRGTLEYVLPVRDVEARAGLDLEGALPAIGSAVGQSDAGWALVTARVGIGF